MQIETNQSTLTFLQQVLNMMASQPDPLQSAELILESAMSHTGASGACFMVFGDSDVCILAGDAQAPDAALEEVMRNLSAGLHVDLPTANGSHPGQFLAAALFSGDLLTGAFYLLVPDGFDEQDEQQRAMLDTLRDALAVLSSSVQTIERVDRAEQLTASIVTSITDPLLVVDDDKQLLFMNPAAEHEFDTSIETAQGQALEDIVQSEELMKFAEDANTSRHEWVSDSGKTYVPHAEPVRDQDGVVEGWVLALRDITHYKKLIRNQHEFTRIVSHDLRSPLTSMKGFANMLEYKQIGELNERQAHFVDRILSGVSQMTALVDNIQDAGRFDPESGFYEMARSQCDIGEIVNRISDTYLVPAEKGELKLTVHVADDVPIINADVNMIERAVINLVDNAIKYTPNGGTVDVHAQTESDQVIISVSDTGFGISPDNLKRLFERHFRIPREEHKRIKGSGLGLFIVRSVAIRHGGDAWVVSEEGKGTTFFISIPLSGANLIGADSDAQ